jgi:uncharacterized protein YdhG (YjbR/CyaY superfamily)
MRRMPYAILPFGLGAVHPPSDPHKISFSSHEAYFATQSPEVRERLEAIQREIEIQVPGAVRTIGYSMPAFKKRRNFIYFAAFKRHIGIYPPLRDDPELIAETASFRGPKGNLSFPYARELPLALIGRVAAALAAQDLGAHSGFITNCAFNICP